MMGRIIFNDLIKSNLRSYEGTRDIKEQALKQLSRCRFVIEDNECVVKVLWKDTIKAVIFNNEISIEELQDEFSSLYEEPSLGFMRGKMTDDMKLLDFLEEYQKHYYKLGVEFDTKYWFKLYSTAEIKDDMRNAYHAGWIDYEKQLESGEIIYDEKELCGLWATHKFMLFNLFNNTCIERYGDKLFVLRPVPDCRYLDDGKEIIGDKYIVEKQYDLYKLNDIGKLCEFLIGIEKEKAKEEIENIKSQLKDSNIKNDKLIYIMNQQNRLKPGLLILMVLLGTIIGYFIGST